jgi:hypothetical protein
MRRACLMCVVCVLCLSGAVGASASAPAVSRATRASSVARTDESAHHRVGKSVSSCGATVSGKAGTVAHGSILLGEGSIEPAVDTSPPGWAQAFAFRSVRAGTVSAVEVYVGRHSRAKRIASGLYSDSSCHPG